MFVKVTNNMNYMKKLLFFLIAIIPLITNAQKKQSVVTLKSGTKIIGVISSIDPTDAVIISIGGVETNIKFDTIQSIEEADNNSRFHIESTSAKEKQGETVKVPIEDPLKNYKGFLLSKGNNVYVYYSNTEGDKNAKYDKEGGMVIRSLIKSDGFWNVVDDMNQAHFTINYCVDTNGRDKANLSISSWRTGKSHLLDSRKTNESVSKNNAVAFDFYMKEIKSLQKKIEKGSISKTLVNDFTIK